MLLVIFSCIPVRWVETGYLLEIRLTKHHKRKSYFVLWEAAAGVSSGLYVTLYRPR
jgi:hypothetical protein